jgi:3-hydroxy-3-methylglutaryl CoA synthase
VSARVAALETHLGSGRNEHGAAVDRELDEVAMAVRVARRAAAGAGPIDAVIFATCGIRPIFPSGAAAITEALGLECPGFDVTAGCASMSVALELAAHRPGTTLVVTSDNLSRTVDPLDPSHAPLKSFGDGAAAALIRRDAGPGPRLVAHRGTTLGSFRRYYASNEGKLVRTIPVDEKKRLGDAYLACWSRIARELMGLCPAGSVPWIYANLFPRLAEALGLADERIVRTGHGHAGGADPWVGLQLQPPPKGGFAVVLGSGIGFTFHGTLVEMA